MMGGWREGQQEAGGSREEPILTTRTCIENATFLATYIRNFSHFPKKKKKKNTSVHVTRREMGCGNMREREGQAGDVLQAAW